MNEEDAQTAALQEYFEDNRPAGYGAAFRAGWDAGRRYEVGMCTHGKESEDRERVAIGAMMHAGAKVNRLKEALRLVYGYAAAIQRMSVYAPIGFRCSLIRETVSRALPDDEAKRLHDETKIILDTLTASE
jgi:hypothetical protein